MKVLTIDFDIIMADSIYHYNNLVPGMTWNELLADPLMKLLPANLDIYAVLTTWLQNQYQHMKDDQFYFIKNHNEVNNILMNDKGIDLVNIDHHHDIGYAPFNCEDRKLSCGNWVHKLMENHQLDSYVWVHNKDFSEPGEHITIECKYDHCLITEPNILKNYTRFDKIIICLSPEWVPPKYQSLYWLWKELYEIHFNKRIDII